MFCANPEPCDVDGLPRTSDEDWVSPVPLLWYGPMIQGVPFEKSQEEMAVALKQCIFEPMLVKPKMRLKSGSFYQFSKICLHFSAVCLQFFKKTASQTHFGFTNIGSNMHRFSATAISF